MTKPPLKASSGSCAWGRVQEAMALVAAVPALSDEEDEVEEPPPERPLPQPRTRLQRLVAEELRRVVNTAAALHLLIAKLDRCVCKEKPFLTLDNAVLTEDDLEEELKRVRQTAEVLVRPAFPWKHCGPLAVVEVAKCRAQQLAITDIDVKDGSGTDGSRSVSALGSCDSQGSVSQDALEVTEAVEAGLQR